MAIRVHKSIEVEVSGHDANSLRIALILAKRYMAENTEKKGCVPCVNEFAGDEVLRTGRFIEGMLNQLNDGFYEGFLG